MTNKAELAWNTNNKDEFTKCCDRRPTTQQHAKDVRSSLLDGGDALVAADSKCTHAASVARLAVVASHGSTNVGESPTDENQTQRMQTNQDKSRRTYSQVQLPARIAHSRPTTQSFGHNGRRHVGAIDGESGHQSAINV